jgi:enamine deaminase RidA (YjgF/YER057c/UK114 family)
VTIGDVIHVSGLMALNSHGNLPESDAAAQMRIVLTRLAGVLAAQNSDLSHVFSTTLHVTADVSDHVLVNVIDAHRRAFSGAAPVSTLLVCPVLPWPGAQVQLSAQASRSAA